MDPKIQKFIKKLKNVWVQRVRKFATILVNTILFIIHELKKETNKQHANANSSEERRTIDGGMGVDLIDRIIEATKEQPSMHNIKMQIENTDLHQHLEEQGFPQHNKNKGIKLQMSSSDINSIVRIQVYPKTIQIDIGCTDDPFPLLPAGAVRLAKLLDQTHHLLCKESLHKAEIPEIGKWLITHQHRGHDGKISYDGEKFHILCENALGMVTRAYSKGGKNGTSFVRVEEIRTERIRVADLLNLMRDSNGKI